MLESALPGGFAQGLQLQIKGITRSVWPSGNGGWRRVRGEAGCSNRQSRVLAVNKVIFLLLGNGRGSGEHSLGRKIGIVLTEFLGKDLA